MKDNMSVEEYLNQFDIETNVFMNLSSTTYKALQIFFMTVANGNPDNVRSFVYGKLDMIKDPDQRKEVARDTVNEIAKFYTMISAVNMETAEKSIINITFNPEYSKEEEELPEIDEALYLALLKTLGFDVDTKLKSDVDAELKKFKEEEKNKKEDNDLGLEEPDPDKWELN